MSVSHNKIPITFFPTYSLVGSHLSLFALISQNLKSISNSYNETIPKVQITIYTPKNIWDV